MSLYQLLMLSARRICYGGMFANCKCGGNKEWSFAESHLPGGTDENHGKQSRLRFEVLKGGECEGGCPVGCCAV